MASANPEPSLTRNQAAPATQRRNDQRLLAKASTIDEAHRDAPRKPDYNHPPKNSTTRSKLTKAKSLSCQPTSSSSKKAVPQTEPIKPRPTQILPRISQYEKHPLLQERTASGLSELEEFLLEKASSKTESNTFKCEVNKASTSDVGRQKLKLEPRGALYERNALLEKTGSGLTELERILQDKEKEFEKKEKKNRKRSKEMRKEFSLGSGTSGGKHLWLKKGITVEKARSFERTACLEKRQTIDLPSNVNRARSLEGESSLEKVNVCVPISIPSIKIQPPKVPRMESGNNNPACLNEEQGGSNASVEGVQPELNNSAKKDNLDNDLGRTNNNIQCGSGASSMDPASNKPLGTENTILIDSETKAISATKKNKKKLLDLALRPNLEWKEDQQQFVMFVQSPVSPVDYKPENLLICIEHQRESDCDGVQVGCNPLVVVDTADLVHIDQGAPGNSAAPQEQVKPKKYVHPSVIDSDSDSEGMVCMDELESIDFNMSTPEQSPAKTTNYKTLEEKPLITHTQQPSIEAKQDKPNEAPKGNPITKVLPRELLSHKRGSLGRLEPRMEQYEKHALLEDRDELGRSLIEKFLEEKEKEILHTTENNSLEGGDDVQKHQPKASIKRVHFEKSDTPEIEELGIVQIEVDPASTNSLKESVGKRISFRGLRGSKNSSKDKAASTPEEQQSLTEDSEVKDKGKGKKTKDADKCCCVS